MKNNSTVRTCSQCQRLDNQFVCASTNAYTCRSCGHNNTDPHHKNTIHITHFNASPRRKSRHNAYYAFTKVTPF